MKKSTGGDCSHPESQVYENYALGGRACGLCGKVVSNADLRVESVFPSGAGQSQPAVIPRFRPITRTIGQSTTHSTFSMSKTCMEGVQRDLINLSHRLQTSTSVVETAKRLYAMLNERRMHTGVERRVTLGVCLYIACRLEKTNHVLSQFVHGVGTSVNVFTALFVRISHTLELGLHCSSTESYLETLVDHLELGTSAPIILARAEEVLERMHEEWIDYGRYPFGIVAAAVLIACQMSGHSQCVEKLSQMVMLSSQTLLTRLREFQRTKAVRDGSHSESSVPPCFRSQRDAQYLVRRLSSYNARLRDLRSTLIEMAAGAAHLNSPMIAATWKSYWNTRAVAAALCHQIAAASTYYDESQPVGDISAEKIEFAMLKYGIPAYLTIESPPTLNMQGMEYLRRDIAIYDDGNSVEPVSMKINTESTEDERCEELAQLKAKNGDDFYLNAIESEAHEPAHDVWMMVTLQDSPIAAEVDGHNADLSTSCATSVFSKSSRIERFPEIEYDEKIIKCREAFITDALLSCASVTNTRVVQPRITSAISALSNSSMPLHCIPSDISFRTAFSAVSKASRRTKSYVSVSGSSPGLSMLARVKKGLRSKVNEQALVELLDGKSEGIDVPSWNESVVNMQNLRGSEDALSTISQ